MATSFQSARLFLRTGRFGSRHQKKKDSETIKGQSEEVDTKPAAVPAWSERKESREEVPAEKEVVIQSYAPTPRARTPEETMKETIGLSSQFQGLPPSLQLESQSFLDDDELRALGITTGLRTGTSSRASSNPRSPAVAFNRIEEEDELDDVFEMEVPIQIVRDRRPDLQVSIPQMKTSPSRSPRLTNSAITAPTPHSAMSTASMLKSSRPLKSGTTATPRSIVSPLSVVEMPKPQRPFSTESIEGMVKDSKTTNRTEQYQVISSKHIEEFERKMTERGGRSSSASTKSDAEQPIEDFDDSLQSANAYRVDTAALYHAALVSTPSIKLKKNHVPPNGSPMPNLSYIRRQASSTSLATTSTVNFNKPLPPEPGRPGASSLKHIAYTSTANARPASNSRTPSRSNSISERKKKSPQLDKPEITSPTSIRPPTISRKNSGVSLSKVSLRSKYTPKDLDAMDDAFQRRPTGTARSTTHGPYANLPTPSQSQVSLSVDAKQLHPIVENSPRGSDAISLRTEPLQISRGPMKMEPTRRPPQPPQRVHTIAVEKLNRRKPAMPRSASNTQLGTQARAEEPPQRRSSTTEPMSKAERILGKSGIVVSARSDIRPSIEFNWNSNDPPKDYTTTETSEFESDEDDMAELDTPIDAQELEIRKRLALLSSKDDPSSVFEAFHKSNSDRYANKPHGKVVHEPTTKPTIEEKLHLTGSATNEINVPTHIAELEAANRTPSPAELPGSFLPTTVEEPAELGVTSPSPFASIPIPPEPEEAPPRRGRFATSNPQSTASGKSRSLHSQRSVRVRSLASLAASDIPDIYASLPTPSNQSRRPSTSGEEVDELITADAAERVLLHILQSLDNLEDLFAASMVSKGFYRTFKRHELFLLKRAIKRMSPAAWELREMSIPYSELPPGATDYTPNLYFRHYVQDLLTMVELKAMILESCKSFLRQDTISGLAGETDRSAMIDEAFWRVWTFCRIFGCGNNREDDIIGQMDWLKGGILARQGPDTRTLALTDELARNSVLFNPPEGFAKGNGKGLNAEELYDMYEIWTCLAVLVHGYHGKRKEAREYGVYDRCNVPEGDEVRENAILEEWTHHLLTLAPSTVLDVTSPATPTRTQFAQARSQGYTTWVPPKQGASRSTFLKEAVSRVYEELLAGKRPSAKSSPRSFSNLAQAASPTLGADAAIASRARIARHAEEIRKRKDDPNFKNVPVSDDRPLSNYSDVLDRLEAISTATNDAPPMPKLPGLAARLSRHKSKGNSSIAESTKTNVASPAPSTMSFAPPTPATLPPPVPSIPKMSAAIPNTSNSATPLPKAPAAHKPDTKENLKAPKTPIPQSSPSRSGAGRFSSLRGHITPKRLDKKSNDKKCKQTPGPTSPIQAPIEKLPVLPNSVPNGVVPSGPQVRDPVDLAVEKLVEMGFEVDRAKKALAQTDNGNGINLESALQKLTKEKEKKKRLERLETMG